MLPAANLLLCVMFVMVMVMLFLHHTFLLATRANALFGDVPNAPASPVAPAPSTLDFESEVMHQLRQLNTELVKLQRGQKVLTDLVTDMEENAMVSSSAKTVAQPLTPPPQPQPPHQPPQPQPQPIDSKPATTVSMTLQCGGRHVVIDQGFVGFTSPYWVDHSPDPEQIASIDSENKIKLSTHGKVDLISSYLKDTGMWERPLMRMVEAISAHYRNTHQKMAFFDIGSNLGLFGMLAASYGHQAFFFEPVPPTATHVCESAHINGFGDHTTVFPFAVSNKRDTFYMAPQSHNFGAASLNANKPSQLQQIEVATITLDEVFPKLNLDSDTKLVLKIDAEGSEYNIFAGASNTLALSNVEVIFFENSWLSVPGEQARWEWLKSIVRSGFSLHCCMNCLDFTPEKGRCLEIDVNNYEEARKYAVEVVAVRSLAVLNVIAMTE